MDSSPREFAHYLQASMTEQGAPLSDAQMAALDIALDGKVTRKRVAPHVLQDDSVPWKIKLIATLVRDETAEEAAEITRRAEKRLEIMLWKAKDGPPPEGVGFDELATQGTWWVPKGSPPVKIADMNIEHRRNVIAYLQRYAEKLKFAHDFNLVHSFPSDPPDGVADALDGIQAELETTTPIDWINSTTLMKALRKADRKASKEARKALAR